MLLLMLAELVRGNSDNVGFFLNASLYLSWTPQEYFKDIPVCQMSMMPSHTTVETVWMFWLQMCHKVAGSSVCLHEWELVLL